MSMRAKEEVKPVNMIGDLTRCAVQSVQFGAPSSVPSGGTDGTAGLAAACTTDGVCTVPPYGTSSTRYRRTGTCGTHTGPR